MAAGNTFDPLTLSGISAGFEPFHEFDDTVAFADDFADESSFPPDWDQQTPPYENQLYSAQLNWEAPQPKSEPIPMTAYATASILTPAQQEKLRQIAMPNHLQYRSSNSPKSTTSTKSHSVSSPDSNKNSNGNRRKRKSSIEEEDDEDEDSNGQHPPVKKTAHNMIEKRYRTNLNDKIAALRDSVPSLRIMTKSARGEDTADDREELQGLTPAHKLNKATVLSKATEYINHLEKRNKRLQEENAAQKARLAAFETLFRSGSMGLNPAPMNSSFQYSTEYNTPGPSPTQEAQGMIQVPENIRRLQAGMNQQIYQVPQEQYRRQVQQPVGPNGWQNGVYFGKLMVGSLAGLMVMEGFSATEQQDQSPNARGLFALPTQVLRSVSQGFHSSLNFSFMGYRFSTAQTLAYLKSLLVVGALLYVFLPLLVSKPKAKEGKEQGTTVVAAPSLAAPIQVRRRAWLTAIQTVWVPRHNFFLEATALCLKMLKLSMRNVVGAQGYAYITGITQQQEAARVKAWTIALDAQLAGGDAEINMSRLTLTLMASGTLPDSPARLMLKALHVRVLLWEVGNSGFNGFYMFHEVAAKMARWKWNEAKSLQRLVMRTKEKLEDELPEYLAILLEQDCDDVLSDAISQRAYNLAWDLPTSRNSQISSGEMNTVVDDFAIRSPLDAVAAWYSSTLLQRAITKSLELKEGNPEVQTEISEDVSLAIRTAPIGSEAQIKALVARAVIFKEKRGFNIAAALQALEPLEQRKLDKDGHSIIHPTNFISNLPDIKMSLRCAMAIAHLDRYPAPANPEAANRIIRSVTPASLTLLSFASTFKLMEKIYGHSLVSVSCSSSLENLAGNLRVWIGGKEGEMSGIEREVRIDMVNRCLIVRKRASGMMDAGYGSMSDDADVEEDC